jgi:hypothetical protein
MSNPNKIEAGMDKFSEEKALGLNFSGKSSIESLDLLDFQKKEFCTKLVKLYKEMGSNEELMKTKMGATSLAEARSALKFRTERLTLERLVELYSRVTENGELLSNFRMNLITAVKKHPGLSKIKMNDGIRNHLNANDPNLLHLDFLVGLIEKLELVSPTGKPNNISLLGA